MKIPEQEQQRRRAIAWTLSLAENTSLAPLSAEQALLECYARGECTLDQILVHLDEQVYHVLYRSQAIAPLRDEQLNDLLSESQVYNEEHEITGLLCHGDGFFVQVLEGVQQAVQTLYAMIRRDARHRHVVTLREATAPQRLFPDWRMAFVRSDPVEMYWLITHFEARRRQLVLPQVPITHPHLLTLLAAFQAQAQP